MDIKKLFQEVEQKKNEMLSMVNDVSDMLGNSIESKEDVDYLKSLLNDAMQGKDVNTEELNKRVQKMTKNAS